MYFESDAEIRTKAEIIAVNEPRTIKAIVPHLPSDIKYRLVIVTQSSAKNSGTILKSIRELRADTVFTVN